MLFNGGAMKPDAFRERVRRCCENWFGDARTVEELERHVAGSGGRAGRRVLRLRAARAAACASAAAWAARITSASRPIRARRIRAAKRRSAWFRRGLKKAIEIELPQSFHFAARDAGRLSALFVERARGSDKLGAIIDEESKELAPLPPLETDAARRTPRDEEGCVGAAARGADGSRNSGFVVEIR